MSAAVILPIAGFLTMKYWLGPVLTYAGQRTPLAMGMRPADPDQLAASSPSFARLRRTTEELVRAGYSEPRWFRVTNGAVTTLGALLEHPAEGVLATVAAMWTEEIPPQFTVILESDWKDGFSVLTSNSAAEPVFPDMPGRDAMTLPRVQDAVTLHRVHRARVERARPRREPVRLSRGADPIAAEQLRQRRNAERQVRIGYSRLRGDHVRPTLRGACLMTWRLLFPWKHLQRRARDLREAALLRELGIAAA